MKGWGPNVRYVPRNQGNQMFLGMISRDFAGISWGCPKSFKKKIVFILRPIHTSQIGCTGRGAYSSKGRESAF